MGGKSETDADVSERGIDAIFRKVVGEKVELLG